MASHLGISLDPSENTTPETEPVTEPETEPVTDPVTEPVTDAEVDTGNCEGDGTTEEEPQLEPAGCFSTISSTAIILASVCVLFVLKKKND